MGNAIVLIVVLPVGARNDRSACQLRLFADLEMALGTEQILLLQLRADPFYPVAFGHFARDTAAGERIDHQVTWIRFHANKVLWYGGGKVRRMRATDPGRLAARAGV